MRIAMVGQKGLPAQYGGIERHVEQLSRRLGLAGHEVLVYTRTWFGTPSENYAKGVRAVITPTIYRKHLDAIVHTLTSTVHAIRSKADIIHYHGVGPSLLAWIPRIFAPQIKVVATFHCIDRKHQKWSLFARFMLGLGERCACLFPHQTIVVSKTLQSYCDNRFNCLTEYIPNGIEEPAAASHEDESILTKFGLEPGNYILMVSRLVRHKGAHHLIDAYQELERNGRINGKKCVIVGGSAFTTDYIDELLRKAEGDPNIIFTGYQSGCELKALFANAYLVVHPSESEGLPIAVLEAMSYGQTVLASDIPENMEVTRTYGINFHNRDVRDLQEKLEFLLASPNFVADLGERAKEFVLLEYHWDDIARSVDTLYCSLPNSKISAAEAPSIR
ncbi:glycosyltransferase family 4 protein [Patescibacteria group bacterium]|nr:glycosyltransferase family 4 protein [Patescibacteria group bacterium]MBU1029412.1 glycosyltransferase family 4 protein [Patescibacteria group bacterium]MBU1915538.1 glycosyltransferase family 4 protein [Patescibacteria group bacterium]